MTRRLSILWLIAILILPSLGPQNLAQSAPAPVTVELPATDDARIQGGSPDVNFPSSFLYVATLNGHFVLTQFDLLALPANATIDSAVLELNFTSVLTGPNDIEVGRVEGAWDETTLTWNSQPPITWGGPVQTVTTNAVYSWDVTQLVSQWHAGARPNHGFGLRGNGGELVAATSKETGIPPTLVITYTVPPTDGPHTDLGDAPDSTNNLGLPNTAYPAVLGNFPTVWGGTPPGDPAGPRHVNPHIEAVLGEDLSREQEADGGADQDGLNNILNGGTDNRNNDRVDEGWRNPTATFDHCQPTTLIVRVRKSSVATLNRMFLNVWFDGTHDADWNDRDLCTPPSEALNVPAYEWIVQDYYVDLTGIPAGGYVDIAVNTEVVLNTTPEQRHWMRFTLSEDRAVKNANGRADGRGPNPNDTPAQFRFGETEDVLQRPQSPGEPGTLEIQKRVLVPAEPVDYGATVTYQILLRQAGGSQPMQARLRDMIPFPQHLLPTSTPNGPVYVAVESATGGAAPLQATLDVIPPQPSSPPAFVVRWQGTLAPDAEVKLTFKVHVHPYCAAGQETVTITNVAEARPQNGAIISAEDSFLAKCFGYDEDEIEFEFGDPIETTLDPSDLSHVSWRAKITNNHPFKVTLGFFQQGSGGPGVQAATAARFLDKLTLGPGEQKDLELFLNLDAGAADDLNGPDEAVLSGNVSFCFLSDASDACPDAQAYPHLVGDAPPITITVAPRDLGDAPDSTNHAGAAMAAYPGVQANFPTVFDPATGLPEGPMHARPGPLHLGPLVSREAEADIGPDQDPANNILPAANTPNQDRFDDGVNPSLWALADCQATTIPVRVFISNQAWNWFVAQQKPAFLNLWIDANRDGDWADGKSCAAGQDAEEHIVIDHQVDVIGLGAGLHTISVPTGLVPWLAAEQPAWVRVTLSERESNKTLQLGAIKYGDGRGYGTPFKLGETEDYRAHPQGVPGAPDLDVQLAGKITSDTAQQPGAALTAGERLRFKIDYANMGSRPASGARLTFTIPERLRDLEIILLEAPGVPPGNITQGDETVTIDLPDLAPGDSGRVVLGWATFPSSLAAAQSYTASVQASLTNDSDPSNNSATATVERGTAPPFVAIVTGNGTSWSLGETTCGGTVDLAGTSAPGEQIDLLLDGKVVTTITDADGSWAYQLQNLADGEHTIQAVPHSALAHAIISPRDPASGQATGKIVVDRSLPIDPSSLVFTDSQGRSFHPATLEWASGAGLAGNFLRDGESYEVGVDSCVSDPNMRAELSIIAILIGLLQDSDGDGRYTGGFVFDESGSINARSAAAPLQLTLKVTTGGVSRAFALELEGTIVGYVRDALTGQALPDSSIATLAARPSGTNGLLLEAWPAAALGQPNPQLSGADGSFTFRTPGGANRLDLARAGYQPYRSWNIDGAAGRLNQPVALTPEIAGPATHTIYVTEHGFEPAVLQVAPGSVIEWINADVEEHSASGAAWDSGALAPGQRFRTVVAAPGTYSYADGANPLAPGTLVVEGGVRQVFLPEVVR